jgi:hypothetical protein
MPDKAKLSKQTSLNDRSALPFEAVVEQPAWPHRSSFGATLFCMGLSSSPLGGIIVGINGLQESLQGCGFHQVHVLEEDKAQPTLPAHSDRAFRETVTTDL